jgi:hypothetical protein
MQAGGGVICGAEIQGTDLVLVGVEQTEEGGYCLVPNICTKLGLADGKDQATVKDFSRAVAAFIRNHNVRQIALRGRNPSGQFAGGPASFKIEGIVQCLDDCFVEIIMPVSVSAAQRRYKFVVPSDLFRYRESAFLTGCAALAKKSA